MAEFSWAITNSCNYNCSYCYAKKSMENSKDGDTSYKFILQRLKMCQVVFDIALVGGEPTRHPKLQFIIDELDKIENCRVLEIYSNFTRPVDYYFKWRNIKKLNLKMSYHSEYHDNFIGKLKKAIEEKKTNFLVLINLSPNDKYWNNTEEILKLCKNNGIEYEINYLLSTETVQINYTEKFYEFFDDYITDNMNAEVEHIIGNKIYSIPESKIFKLGLSYRGMSCIPRMYRIESSGDIINSCSGKRPRLVIREEELAQSYICQYQSCGCSAMLLFNKVRK
ncbi:MAG TPA: radical SAM protein [Bacteriovoracaceae bacterium]|nr:radical SAM protein [Bacteriovoracaceae bacterium]